MKPQFKLQRLLSLILGSFLLLTSFFAFSECYYDPEGNLKTLKKLAKLQPNGEVYSESNSVIWGSGAFANELYYGGCDVLKFRIINKLDADETLSEAEAFSVANKMASIFWHKEDAYELAVKLASQSFNREDLDGDKRVYRYIMNNPDYAEMTMLFDRIDNSITIEWIKAP